jgi:phosphoserine phosphatase RsbU/P
MNATTTIAARTFRPQLLERRVRLQAAGTSVSAEYLNDLLAEIDSALGRIDNGSFGICETCHDPIEADRLEANPTVRFCLDHLSRKELAAHQQDLDLATQIQSRLLPARDIVLDSWDTQYRYQPVGAVGGDYCDVIAPGGGRPLFFAVGDVAGKGVAASLLMTHLSAIFRSLLSLDLPLGEVVGRANRLFCESTAPAHYATLACGRTTAEGVELCNAGHCRPLVFQRGAVERFEPTGLPIGLFAGAEYGVRHIGLGAGESLALYSDGITEAQDPDGEEYQEERLIQAVRQQFERGAGAMADGVLQDVARFRRTRPPVDDITLLIVQRTR